MYKYIKFFKEITLPDVPQVGGKNASLGEMQRNLAPKGVNLPNGFATTAKAYYYFIEEAGIREQMNQILDGLDAKNIRQLKKCGAKMRAIIMKSTFPADFEDEIRTGYRELSKVCGKKDLVVAVRSSATAEDLPNASFAGQQETYLNISGEDIVVQKAKECIASLFTDRAIAYRETRL
jgi:pyruvate,water dikinase